MFILKEKIEPKCDILNALKKWNRSSIFVWLKRNRVDGIIKTKSKLDFFHRNNNNNKSLKSIFG